MLAVVARDDEHTARAVESSVVDELLARVARGDRQAFADLYDRVADRVFGLVRRVLADPSQSEEVTQEIFLELWQTATRYEEGSSKAIGWILTIAHRRAVDRVRASQASRDRDLRIGVRDFQERADDVEESVEISIEHEKVVKAMATLSDAQREAIELAYYGGLSHSEVAARLDVPIGTVKTRLRDGLIRLRGVLGVTA